MITTSFAQPVQIIALVGLVAGVLIAGIVLYTATVEHFRDYAVLKAVGAGAGVVYGSALLQSVVLSFFGVILGWGLAAALAGAFDVWDPVIESRLDFDLGDGGIGGDPGLQRPGRSAARAPCQPYRPTGGLPGMSIVAAGLTKTLG